MTTDDIQDTGYVLRRAIGHLVQTRNPQGNWGDIRSTALASWAFSELQSSMQNSETFDTAGVNAVVEDTRMWLSGQGKREEGGISWESEAWDTALAILALSPNKAYDERLDLASAWLRRISDPHTGSWYEDIWETILSATALLRRESYISGPRNQDTIWLARVFDWICMIPSKPTGEFVSPHYTGFLVLLRNETRRANFNMPEGGTFEQFESKAAAAEQWLLDKVASHNTYLWSTYTFANAYILYALATTESAKSLEYSRVIAWFKRRQGQHGGFEDIEDTALTVLALSAAVRNIGVPLSLLLHGLSVLPPKQCLEAPKCFLGYSGQSKALAIEIKEFIAKMLASIEIKDWRWDFTPGRHLFNEIDTVSQECRLAIFLITKDDHLAADDGSLRSTPRDNIVFETGFFVARIGISNTILIVEEGTKLPTDLGGILYIPLRDRNDISHMTMPLLSTIKRILCD